MNVFLFAAVATPALQPSDSWIGTLLSGSVGAVIGAAAAVISAVVVVRYSYKDQRRIAAEGRARRAAVEFLTKLRGVTGIKSGREAEIFRNELEAAGTLWVIEEDHSQEDVRILTRAIVQVFSDAWKLEDTGIESLFTRTKPAMDVFDLYSSAHVSVLELLEGNGADSVHHFLASYGMNPDGSEFLD